MNESERRVRPEQIRASSGDAGGPEPVDAMHVPERLTGMRTLFEGFHHFRPGQAERILRHATETRAAIGVFEASLKPPLGPIVLVLSPLMTLLGYVFGTPFIRPYRLSRLFWTYAMPLLRVYSVPELQAMTGRLRADGYEWEAGHASTGTPLFEFTYLVGYPVRSP